MAVAKGPTVLSMVGSTPHRGRAPLPGTGTLAGTLSYCLQRGHGRFRLVTRKNFSIEMAIVIGTDCPGRS